MSERRSDWLLDLVQGEAFEEHVLHAGLGAVLVVGVTGLHLGVVSDALGVLLVVMGLLAVFMVRLDYAGRRVTYRPVMQVLMASTPPLILWIVFAGAAGNDKAVVLGALVLLAVWLAGPEEGSRILERRAAADQQRQ